MYARPQLGGTSSSLLYSMGHLLKERAEGDSVKGVDVGEEGTDHSGRLCRLSTSLWRVQAAA